MKYVFALEYTVNPFGGLSCERSIQILAKAVKERLKMRGGSGEEVYRMEDAMSTSQNFPLFVCIIDTHTSKLCWLVW